ncbi:MAG: hypothetical protein JWO56_2587 [Acidobacteria bacterium]|nr:hypothetical protein [Acidobacteriota bacterium]
MKNPPTYEDANLILKLYDLRREEKMREARKWMAAAPQFASREEWLTLCPPGSDTNAYYRMVMTYWEMAASFVATGVLNRELFYRANNLEMLLMWEKVKVMVPELSAAANNPAMMRSIEEVATGFIAYLKEYSPGYYETFSVNIAKMGRK